MLLTATTACKKDDKTTIAEPDISSDYPLLFYGDIQEIYQDTTYQNQEHKDTLWVEAQSKNTILVRLDSIGSFTCQIAGQASGHSLLNPKNGSGAFSNIRSIDGSYLRQNGSFTFVIEGETRPNFIYQISFSGKSN